MCILASCIAGAAQTEFRTMLEGALNVGVTPVEAKEVVYQAVPYVGMARTVDFVHIVNGVLTARGVALPLEGESATFAETRFEKGLAVQKAIFGERIDAMRAAAPENQKHMQDYLSANCSAITSPAAGWMRRCARTADFLDAAHARLRTPAQGTYSGQPECRQRQADVVGCGDPAAALYRLSAYAECDRLPERSDT